MLRRFRSRKSCSSAYKSIRLRRMKKKRKRKRKRKPTVVGGS
jgi:hypothetical protein